MRFVVWTLLHQCEWFCSIFHLLQFPSNIGSKTVVKIPNRTHQHFIAFTHRSGSNFLPWLAHKVTEIISDILYCRTVGQSWRPWWPRRLQARFTWDIFDAGENLVFMFKPCVNTNFYNSSNGGQHVETSCVISMSSCLTSRQHSSCKNAPCKTGCKGLISLYNPLCF